MKKNRIDILNLEWPNSDRDLHIVTPVLLYLEKHYNLRTKSKSMFQGFYYIWKYRPKLLLASNLEGATINHCIGFSASRLGIKVVSLISEGNVKEENSEQYLWGWNEKKKMYADKKILWSYRSKELFLKKNPELKNKLSVSGATGFDRYSLLKFVDKEKFIKENSLAFTKVVGIAAWGFDHFWGEYFEQQKGDFENIYSESQIEMFRNDLFKLQEIYRELVTNNPDILFILRYHPGTIDLCKNEFYKIREMSNVFISDRSTNLKYNISDLINISDLWIAYESTTALEAWLLKKQTFLINPTRSDFIRENVHKGSPVVKDSKQAQKLIDEFFLSGSIKSFERLEKYREQIIKDTIEWDDGKNHERAAKEVIEVWNEPHRKIKFPIKFYTELLKECLRVLLSKTIMPRRWSELRYKKDFAEKYRVMYKDYFNL